MAGLRVLVTRPEPGAARTAARLARQGHVPLVLPLTETTAIDPGPAPAAGAFDAVAATSQAALRHLPAAWHKAIGRLPLYAVGAATAEAARPDWQGEIISAEGDAAALAELLCTRIPHARLLYPCGRMRTAFLEDRLAAAGMTVRAVEVYATRRRAVSPGEVESVIGGGGIDAVLVHSAAGAAALADFMSQGAVAPLFEHSRLLCISARAARALGGGFDDRIAIAAHPDEAALLALLER